MIVGQSVAACSTGNIRTYVLLLRCQMRTPGGASV